MTAPDDSSGARGHHRAKSTQTIETSHAGSLPRTPELIAANDARRLADDGLTLERTPEFDELLTAAVVDLVRRQQDLGITVAVHRMLDELVPVLRRRGVLRRELGDAGLRADLFGF